MMSPSYTRHTRPREYVVFAAGLVVGFAVTAAAQDAARLDPDSYRPRPETLTSRECQAIYLTLMENFVGWSESKFVDDDTYEPGGGRFEAKGHGVDWARGNSNLCIAYAVLLAEYPQRTTFTIHAIPRADLQEHLRKTIRYLCLAYQGDGDRKWGPGWQVSLDFIGCAWAAHLVEASLDSDTVRLVREVTCAVADSLDKAIPSRRFGDTGSEDCTWNAPFLAFAANKYADDPRAVHWDRLCKRWALNALSTAQDKESEALVEGRPLKEWIVSENVHPDLTIENHNMWSVGYQIQCQFFAEGELAYKVFGREPPEAFAHHADAMWNGVTRALYLWDGDILFPTGQDWSWKSYSGTEYLAWQRMSRGNAAAAAYESRAIQMVLKRQLAVGTGAPGFSDFGNNTTKPKRWAFSYLCHRYQDDLRLSTMAEAYKESLGVYRFPHVKAAIHRAPTKCVSVSWHERNQPIYILPEGDSTFSDPPFFIPYDPAAGGVGFSYRPQENGPEQPVAWTKTDLIEAAPTHDGHGLRVTYTRTSDDGTVQYVGIVSLPDEATVYCTAFRAGRPGAYRIANPFHVKVDSIQGFPPRLEAHRGERWFNLSDHLAFVSSRALPKELPPGVFHAANEITQTVNQGEWFGAMAVAVYARQPHASTKQMAERFGLTKDDAEDSIAVRLTSSSGDTTLNFDLP